jgi:uncharacterized protein YndB with AHSA1/START domain
MPTGIPVGIMNDPANRTPTMTDPETSARQFARTLDLAAPREAVWRALTDGAEIRRWFAPTASVDPKVGGALVWQWDGHFHWPQTIEVFEPGRHLRTRYDTRVDGGEATIEHPLFIDWQLEGEGGRTTLRIVHSGFGADECFDDEYDGISRGWPVELESLRLYLERHRGNQRQLCWSRATIDAAPDAVWQALIADGALACGTGIAELGAGAAFAFTTADGDHFAGRVVTTHARELVAIAASHGDGFLRFWVDAVGGKTHLWLWLATYGDTAPVGLQARWDALVERLFAGRIRESNAS